MAPGSSRRLNTPEGSRQMPSDRISIETCYLDPLLAVACFGLPDSAKELPSRPLSDSMWLDLLGLVRDHRLTGLLSSALKDGALPATAEQRLQAQQLQLSAMTWAMRLELELVELISVLAQANADFRVLKGPSAAHLDYRDPNLRPFADLDILVRSDQIDTVVVALDRAGFQRRDLPPTPGFDRRFSKGATFLGPTGYELDLHRTFVKGAWGLLVDLDDLWDGGEEFVLAGRTVRGLSRSPRFMHACYNAALGNWPPRLASLRDVAQMILTGDLDYGAVRALSHHWHADAVVAAAVCDAWNLLGVRRDIELSEWARGVVPSGRDAARLALHRSENKNASALAISALSAIPGVRDKVAFLRAMLVPEARYIDGRHQSATARLRHGMREVRRSRQGRHARA